MKQYIPVAGVILALLILYNSMPKVVTAIFGLILVTLLINKWSELETYFK